MQYKREEVRDMNLYGEILKKLEGTPCLALERSFVGEEGNLADMRCELKEGAAMRWSSILQSWRVSVPV